jgi:hypothetical protein
VLVVSFHRRICCSHALTHYHPPPMCSLSLCCVRSLSPLRFISQCLEIEVRSTFARCWFSCVMVVGASSSATFHRIRARSLARSNDLLGRELRRRLGDVLPDRDDGNGTTDDPD